jgi:tRNA nucleotidyltransferase (CCA-adding enzyme)
MNVAILCEGKTDKYFLKLFLEDLGLDVTKVVFFILDGKSNFFKKDNEKYEELLIELNTEKINKILFVLDADNIENDSVYGGYSNTENELNKTISSLKLSNYDTYIVCDPKTKEGYLESLILSTLSIEQKNCITNFLDCSDFKGKESHKAIINQIYKQAYPSTPYDFSHKNFNELKTKLKDLFNE